MRFQCKKRRSIWEWNKWFAWYPVALGEGECCWLEWIWRRGVSLSPYDFGWEYLAANPDPNQQDKGS